MAERETGLWWYRLLFVGFAALVMFVHLLPLDPGPGRFPGPDLLLLLALSWAVARPELITLPLLVGVFLFADLLLMRPPGLWTALTVLGYEFLRSRHVLLRNATFPTEWLIVGGVVAAMSVVNALILGIFAVPQPTLGLTMIRMVFTILAYPLVVFLAGRAVGLSKVRVERDVLGARR